MSGFGQGLEPNQTKPRVKTRTADGLPGPIANLIYGPSSCTSWTIHGHSDTEPSGCPKGIPLLCIMSSLSSKRCSTIWMELCECWPRRRHQGRKTYTSLWRLRDRGCPNSEQNSVQRPGWFSFQQMSSIGHGSWHYFASGARRCILILSARHPILSNSTRPLRRMWKTYTAQCIDECQSLHPTIFCTAISSPLQQPLDVVNCLSVHTICPALMKNT